MRVPTPLPVAFARPDALPAPGSLRGRVAVLDLALDGADPGRSLAWAAALGDRLAAWVDHHEQPAWACVAGDSRFVFRPRDEAPACPPLVTAERVARLGPADTIVAHGDLDGVLAAAKWMILQAGRPVPAWLDPDSIAADSRRGRPGPRGARLDAALRSGRRGDRLRWLVLESVWAEAWGAPEPPGLAAELDAAAADHARLADRARELAAAARPLVAVPEDAVVVDLRRIREPVDLTSLLLELQARHDWAIVIARGRGGGRKIVVGTDPERSGLDLRRELGVAGYAPFRVRASAEALTARLPDPALGRALAVEG
ncbi:MAG: hypothetical protein D6702_10760 [Planctomycetota bacterium]|nr:MAG: hypothetical protein D6702_10760 [Planctomycetota bacterium]